MGELEYDFDLSDFGIQKSNNNAKKVIEHPLFSDLACQLRKDEENIAGLIRDSLEKEICVKIGIDDIDSDMIIKKCDVFLVLVDTCYEEAIHSEICESFYEYKNEFTIKKHIEPIFIYDDRCSLL
jgi:hypothetical protein